MGKNRKPNENVIKQSVLKYFQKKKEFELATSQFEESKEQFYSDMEGYFNDEGITSKEFDVSDELDCVSLLVTRAQTSKVTFNVNKLKKALGDVSADVINKRYEIADIRGLIAYLKECGVDPKVFKSFLTISESVNEKELDRLFDVGKITKEQVTGCYTVKLNKPYFTVRAGKGRTENDSEEWSNR